MLYSQDLKPYEGVLSPAVQQALLEIEKYFGTSCPEVFSFDAWHIAVKATYLVSLPTQGAVGGLDIRPEEPVLIYISLEDYPNLAPFILSDRKDFPKTQLSHLYFSPEGEAARFCMVRNDPNEWFAGIKLSDFLDVGGQWLYKAGTGTLNEDGDEFDPTRLEKNVSGRHIYKYDMLNTVVAEDQRLVPEYPMAVCMGGLFFNKAGSISYKSITSVPLLNLQTVTEGFKAIYAKQPDKGVKANPLFSVITWHPDNKVESLYLTNFPVNYGQLKLFFSLRGIALEQILYALEAQNVLFKCGVPIIYAMRRPKKMIGYNGNYEFFHFVLTMHTNGVAATTDDASVCIQGHTEPFSSEMAAYVSGQPRTLPTLYVGAGSLGSKLILHDGRSGNNHIGVADNDELALHNLARHELFAESVGQNKANALIAHITAFFTLENTDNLKAYDYSVVSMADTDFEEYRLLMDSTASVQVRNNLIGRDLPAGLRYCRSEIAHDGRLGLFYAEGSGRNPRMDDLFNLACFLATKKQALREWRAYDAGRSVANLNIGLGCSSATSVMADDMISFHASVFSRLMAKAVSAPQDHEQGLLYLNKYREEDEIPLHSGELVRVTPFDILDCRAGSGWQIRFAAGLTNRLLALCAKHQPKETGGILVGVANYKNKTIQVFDLITEPQDSKGSCHGFTRGTRGLPEAIDRIKEETGGVIGYIGEWHTHPMNLKCLSTVDLATIEELKVINNRVPIPTCAVIVTPDEVLAFVSE